MRPIVILCAFFWCLGLAASTDASNSTAGQLNIPFEKYTLENGLEVVLHQDTSNPIVALAVQYHVGSAREVKGRTGFAHLFEHMLFQESQHVPKDQFFKFIENAGGTLNGFTTYDATTYYEVVPKNALELILWLEADRMGWLLPTVNAEAFANQQDVVQNEKRQRVDNRPYGHTTYVLNKTMYPENHPYNWDVIGSLEDLRNATLTDIRDFYKRWYGPNNATLVLAGDFDLKEGKALIEKYFGEIKRGTEVERPKPNIVQLPKTTHVFHEDNFARTPEINIAYHTVPDYHDDTYPLSILMTLLTDGKKAPLYKIIVEEKGLASRVFGLNDHREIAGQALFRVRAFPGKDLDDVKAAIFEGLERFEKEGFSDQDLERVKALSETSFLNGVSSTLSKSFQLAFYNTFAGDPDYLSKDYAKGQAVTREDIMRVYKKYIKGQHFVATSFVPKGKVDLAVEGSERYPVVEEDLNAKVEKKELEQVTFDRLPSSFDRSKVPATGQDPAIVAPTIWHDKLANGARVLGIEQNELPLVSFTIEVKGGMLLETFDNLGVGPLTASMLREGTKNRTPAELEEAIDALGSSISIRSGEEFLRVSVNCLRRNFEPTLALVEEMLTQPRWDAKSFERLKKETIDNLERSNTRATSIGTKVMGRLLYGHDNILAYTPSGTTESVDKLTLDDLKKYYATKITPKNAHIAVTGDLDHKSAMKAMVSLGKSWTGGEVKLAPIKKVPEVTESKLYFVDLPGAKQSYIDIGYIALAGTHPDYYEATLMNDKLGGGFNSQLNLILREEKGYTYGAGSGFQGALFPSPFEASSNVRSNATQDSVRIFKEVLSNYRNGITEDELEFTKNSTLKSNARANETIGALNRLLTRIARENLPDNYMAQRQEITRKMTLERHRELAQKYLPEAMIYLVVGDAATQLEPLKEVGLGDPILLDKEGKPVK